MGTVYGAIGIAVIGAIIFAPGMLLGAGGLIGMLRHPRPPPPEPPPPPPPSPARDVVHSAVNLARRGDCPAALRLVERGAVLDPTYTAQFAAEDEALVACTQPALAPAPP